MKMAIDFRKIQIGETYTRPELARIWGYAGYQALARGVVTPKDDNKIILFVTEQKQGFQEQYEDKLNGHNLEWEGPTDHFGEERMMNANRSGDEIHVFHRRRHHSAFTYLGRATVRQIFRNSIRPSKFELVLN